MPTSDDETVPVRVEDLKTWAIWFESAELRVFAGKVRAYLPKPRLVQVDLDELKGLFNDVGIGRPYVNPEKFESLIERLEKEA